MDPYIYLDPASAPFLPSPTIAIARNMHAATAVSQSFAPFSDGASLSRQPAPAPGLSASIWAPQPQPSDTTWFRAIDTMSRAPGDCGSGFMRPEFRRASSHPAGKNGEDVFGPVGIVGNMSKKDVGTIGDRRKKTPPDFDHVVRSLVHLRTAYMRANVERDSTCSNFCVH